MACFRSGGREGALDRGQPGRGRVCRRRNQQQAERHGHRRARQPGQHQGSDPHSRSDQQHGDEPVHVVLAAQQHDLRRHRREDRERRQQQAPVAPLAAGERHERRRTGSGHGRGGRGERRDVVGMHDAPGQAQHGRLDQKPATEDDQPREPRVIPARRLRAPQRQRRGDVPAERDHEPDTQQPEEGEREDPAALVAQSDSEQPQRSPRASERDRVPFPAVRQERGGAMRGGRAWRLRHAHGARVSGRGWAVPVGAGRRCGAHERTRPGGNLAGAARLPADPAEAVVFERQPQLGVVGRAAHERPRRGGREFDEGDPRERHDEHQHACAEQLHPPPGYRAGSAHRVGERDPRDDQIGREGLRVECQAHQHAAPQKRAPTTRFGRSQARAAGEDQQQDQKRVDAVVARDGDERRGDRQRESAGERSERAEPGATSRGRAARPRARRRSPRAAAG